MAMKKCQAMTGSPREPGEGRCPKRAFRIIALRMMPEDLFLAVWVCRDHLKELGG